MPRPFLTAHWSDLILLTCEAPEHLIRRLIPPGVEPDRWNGRTHVSVVALRMRDVRVSGWRIPGFTAHPQVNFRTYIRHRGQPGVWFVRELVPGRLAALVGRLAYREPFGTIPIRAEVEERATGIRVSYRVGRRELGWHVTVTATRAAHLPSPSSAERYFTERVLACRARPNGGLGVFRVEHPPWAVREVTGVEYRVDFAALYGPEWRFLDDSTPASVVLAAGSDVAVYPPTD